MKKTLLDADYIERNEKAIVRLFYKTAKGREIEEIKDFQPYLYSIPENGKIDKLETPSPIQEMVAEFPNSLAISARERLGLTELLARVETVLNQELVYVTICIPYRESSLVSLFHRQGTVDREEHGKEGTTLTGRLPARYLGAFRRYLV